MSEKKVSVFEIDPDKEVEENLEQFFEEALKSVTNEEDKLLSNKEKDKSQEEVKEQPKETLEIDEKDKSQEEVKEQPKETLEIDEKKITELEEKITLLSKALLYKEQELKELNQKFIRLYAEYENYRKKNIKERADFQKFCFEPLLKEFIPVLDNFDRAIEHAKSNRDFDSFLEGVDLILKHFLKVLSKFGIVGIEVLGKKFDPRYHEAMLNVETTEYEPNTIIEELRKGYLYHDRLLRPALVSVSKYPEENKKNNL